MNQRTKATTLAATMVLVLAMMLTSVNTATTTATSSIPRNETVWGSGQGMTFTTNNPYVTSTTQSWTTYLMYEPLFGINVANNSMIYWIGRSIVWVNSTCIEVTLKSDAHWTSFDTNNTLGVTNTTEITSTDCVFSYELMAQQGQIPSLLPQLATGSVATSFVVVNTTSFDVLVSSNYANSAEVFRGIVNQLPILPKAVWSNINATETKGATNTSTVAADMNAFTNDWLASGFPAKWMVCSGMYVPYYADTAECIAVRNANWWGASDPEFARLPNPTYWGYTAYPNDAALLALETGDIDWDGNYIPGLTTIMSTFTHITTYEPSLPYFPDKAVDEWVFNYNEYPLNETWVHQAIMTVLNYTTMSQVDSGYLQVPNIMLIPHDDASALATYNATIAKAYTPAYDGTGAAGQAYLKQYANLAPAGSYGGPANLPCWFTKAEVNGKHVPLAGWDGSHNSSITPWTVLDFNGWTDVDAMDVIGAASCSSLLKLNMTVDQGAANQWGTVQGRVNSGKSAINGGFDIFNMVMSGQINMNMYERYFQQFSTLNSGYNAGGGVACPLGNCTNVDKALAPLTGLIAKLNNNTGTALLAIANQIQTLIGQQLPIVPLGGHPDWEIYTTQYWSNWPNSVNNPIQAAGPYIGTSQGANNLLITFDLQQVVPTTTPTSSGISTTVFAGVVIVIIVVAVIAIVLVSRRKPSK